MKFRVDTPSGAQSILKSRRTRADVEEFAPFGRDSVGMLERGVCAGVAWYRPRRRPRHTRVSVRLAPVQLTLSHFDAFWLDRDRRCMAVDVGFVCYAAVQLCQSTANIVAERALSGHQSILVDGRVWRQFSRQATVERGNHVLPAYLRRDHKVRARAEEIRSSDPLERSRP